MVGRPVQFTQAGGAQAIALGPAVIHGMVLTPAAVAAAVTIREGGASGTIVISLQAAANGPAAPFFPRAPMILRDPYISAFTGAGATLAVVL